MGTVKLSLEHQPFYPLLAKNSTAKIELLERVNRESMFFAYDPKSGISYAQWCLKIQLNDVLFEQDPFSLCTHPENDNYLEYSVMAEHVVRKDVGNDIDKLWEAVEELFDIYGCSSRVYKYFLMDALQQVLRLKPFEYTAEESIYDDTQ